LIYSSQEMDNSRFCYIKDPLTKTD